MLRHLTSVSHFNFWLKLAKCGVTGKLLNLFKSMYSKLKSSVKHDGNFSELFSCNIRLMSPFIYAMYVNDIEIELNMLNLYLLMYADDTVLFSENVYELQNMINVVNVCSNENNLHVNLLKTKVVIFRNRGNIKSEEKWFLTNETAQFLFLAVRDILFFRKWPFSGEDNRGKTSPHALVFTRCEIQSERL